jgi:hypothetical protein
MAAFPKKHSGISEPAEDLEQTDVTPLGSVEGRWIRWMDQYHTTLHISRCGDWHESSSKEQLQREWEQGTDVESIAFPKE